MRTRTGSRKRRRRRAGKAFFSFRDGFYLFVDDLAGESVNGNVHVVFNNNRSDFAPNNATQFREMLGQKVELQKRKLVVTRPEKNKPAGQQSFGF